MAGQGEEKGRESGFTVTIRAILSMAKKWLLEQKATVASFPGLGDARSIVEKKGREHEMRQSNLEEEGGLRLKTGK